MLENIFNNPWLFVYDTLLIFPETLRIASGIEKIPGLFLYFAVAAEVAFGYLCICLHTFFHEIGHFLACKMMGVTPYTVRICTKECRFFKTRFYIGLIPVGFVGNPRRPHALQPSPLKQIVVSLGGIGTTAVISAISFVLAAHASNLLKWHLGLFGAIGAAGVIANCMGDDTDGERILFAIRRRKDWPKEMQTTTWYGLFISWTIFMVFQFTAFLTFLLVIRFVCR